MAYLINKSGKRTKIDYDSYTCAEKSAIIHDNTVLIKKYMMNIWKGDLSYRKEDDEFVKEVIFDKYPLPDEMIYHMVTNGLNRYSGYITIDEIFTLDFEDDGEE